ncbi:hypothetical protein BOTBODRAFT_193285 [Botryobasidium botryosum FD-172 SS1]|uniref:Uncharacterized protein n=1 Tax=Botryobasidium botryosum (strain FD-172 SS1) TaxID=930990 RepID=A0A067M2Q1_BOTB1|nr:hypothetical protein BOTBODRAFT_193285 [Botryobasidium botryosum FD-172 SS1]
MISAAANFLGTTIARAGLNLYVRDDLAAKKITFKNELRYRELNIRIIDMLIESKRPSKGGTTDFDDLPPAYEEADDHIHPLAFKAAGGRPGRNSPPLEAREKWEGTRELTTDSKRGSIRTYEENRNNGNAYSAHKFLLTAIGGLIIGDAYNALVHPAVLESNKKFAPPSRYEDLEILRPIASASFNGHSALLSKVDHKKAVMQAAACFTELQLETYRWAEARAWREAQYHYQCVLSTQFYCEPKNGYDATTSPLSREVLRTMLKASEHRFAETDRLRFCPAIPRSDDRQRFGEIRVILEEPELANQLATLPDSSQAEVAENIRAHIQNVKAQRLPFSMPAL